MYTILIITFDNCTEIGTQTLQLWRCRNDSIPQNWQLASEKKKRASLKAGDMLKDLIKKSDFVICDFWSMKFLPICFLRFTG